jgi:hypothetical protein
MSSVVYKKVRPLAHAGHGWEQRVRLYTKRYSQQMYEKVPVEGIYIAEAQWVHIQVWHRNHRLKMAERTRVPSFHVQYIKVSPNMKLLAEISCHNRKSGPL